MLLLLVCPVLSFLCLKKGSIKGLETCLYLLRRQNCSSEHFMYKHNIIHRVNYPSVAWWRAEQKDTQEAASPHSFQEIAFSLKCLYVKCNLNFGNIHRKVWVGRDLKDIIYFQPPCYGQGYNAYVFLCVCLCTSVNSCAIVNQQTSHKHHLVGTWYCSPQVCCCRSYGKQWNYSVQQRPLARYRDLQ